MMINETGINQSFEIHLPGKKIRINKNIAISRKPEHPLKIKMYEVCVKYNLLFSISYDKEIEKIFFNIQ
jgi:hypothetical protein